MKLYHYPRIPYAPRTWQDFLGILLLVLYSEIAPGQSSIKHPLLPPSFIDFSQSIRVPTGAIANTVR